MKYCNVVLFLKDVERMDIEMSSISPHNYIKPKTESECYIENVQEYLSTPRGVIYLDDVEALIDEGNIHRGEIRVLKKGLNKNSPQIPTYEEMDEQISNGIVSLKSLFK